ncbi:MAG: hypothetical protein AAB049_00855 [Nitrospirota bacterium]
MSEKEAMSGNQGKDYRPLLVYAWEYLKKCLTYLLFFISSATIIYLYFLFSLAWAGPAKVIEVMLFCVVYITVGSGIGLFFLAVLKFNEATSLWNAARYGWLTPPLVALVIMIDGARKNIGNDWLLDFVANGLLAIGMPVSPGIIVFFAARLMKNYHPVSECSGKN